MSNTNQTNQSEWISVTDRYPDCDEWVLVSYVECGDTYRFPPNVSRWDGKKWLTRDNEDDLEYEYCVTVTHWMPIHAWKTLEANDA